MDFFRLATSENLADLREAAAKLGGTLLEDVSLSEPFFDDWLSGQRRLISDEAIVVYEKLSQMETGIGKIHAGKRLVSIDPLRERSHRFLIEAFVACSENGLAFRQYRDCCNILKDTFAIEPSEETKLSIHRLSKL